MNWLGACFRAKTRKSIELRKRLKDLWLYLMHAEWLRLPAVDISTVFGLQIFDKRGNGSWITPFISIQESCFYIYISLADKLQFNAFCRAGLQATTCRRIWRLQSIGKRISCVFWQMIYSQWRPASGYMLRSTSFLIKSGRHFRTNRNVNETEKKNRMF